MALLVDPTDPRQVVLAAHANDFGQSNVAVVMAVVLSFMVGGILFMAWIAGGAAALILGSAFSNS